MPTVTIACKLPNGLILDLPSKGGISQRVTLNGVRNQNIDPHLIQNGYALTDDVDQEFWTAWLLLYKDCDPVKRGFVFAHARKADAIAKAGEMAGERTGLEPINPEKPAAGIVPVTAPTSMAGIR